MSKPQNPPNRPRHGENLKRNAGISLAPDLIAQIDAIAGKGNRSRWCEAVLLEAVQTILESENL